MRARAGLVAAAVLVVIPAVAVGARGTAGVSPGATWSAASPGGVAGLGVDTGHVRLRLARAGNEARYMVNEQLAGRPLRNDAIGVTQAITGQLLLDSRGRLVADSSVVSIDLASLKTDQERRDNFVRRRLLEVEQYPTAVFRAREVRGLSWPLPQSGEKTFQLVGDLDLHGVTRPSVWAVTAQFTPGTVTGTARTALKFADHGLEIPRLAFVLSVQDSIRLEYDFTFER